MKKKRLAALCVIVALLLSITAQAAAAENTLLYTVPAKATWSTHGEASFNLTVGRADSEYAGVQFELILDPGITIESVSFNQGSSEEIISPQESHGSVYFSLYSNSNKFKDQLTCSVKVKKQTESTGSKVTIKQIKQVTIVGEANVETLTSGESATITLSNPASNEGNGSNNGNNSGTSTGGGGGSSSTASTDTESKSNTPSNNPPQPEENNNHNEEQVPMAPLVQLSDIEGHWAYEYILTALDQGFISGYPDNTFLPDGKVTRAEFVRMAVVVFALESDAPPAFLDTENHWAQEDIGIAAACGVVKGIGENLFSPNTQISRQDMAVMINQLSIYLGKELAGNPEVPAFSDYDQISGYAAESVQKIQNAGIIEGKGNHTFDPLGNATRAEAVVIILKTLQALG